MMMPRTRSTICGLLMKYEQMHLRRHNSSRQQTNLQSAEKRK